MARTRAHDYDAKRAAVLQHAAALFAQHGYTGTSITMIAQACGVSKALLYHYYSDKETVLFDILSAHLGHLLTEARAAAAAAKPGARLFALTDALLNAYRDADAEHQVQIANLKLLPAPLQEKLRAMERELVDLFADAIAEAVPEVGRGPLLKPIAMSLFGMLNWHYLWFRDGKGLTRSEYASLVTGMIERGAGPTAAALAAARSAAGTLPRP